MKNLKKIGACLSSAFLTMSVGVVPAFATEATEEGIADFMQKGDKDGGIFKDLIALFKSVGADAYQLLLVVGVVLLVICIALLVISNIITKNSTKKEENKDWAVRLAIGGIVLFSIISIVGLLGTIGSKIGESI